MNLGLIILIVFILGFIVSGILLLKQSAKKFNLSDEQKKAIQARQKEQEKKDESDWK